MEIDKIKYNLFGGFFAAFGSLCVIIHIKYYDLI